MTGRPVRPARVGAALVAGLALLLPAGCVSLPESGPVVETRSVGNSDDVPGIFIDPLPPQAGDSAADVVKGFLDAMTATPIQANTARQFLAKDAQASWNPELETVTYADASTPQGNSRVSVTLTGADLLDERGAWQGPLGSFDEILQFSMVVEDGEYRIASAPNQLIVPESWFEQRFRQVSLYFFDPNARTLVPEPVFVPRGQQLATTLVQGLLQGPGAALAGVSQSFVPTGLDVGLSVPVSQDGVAEITLTGDSGQQTPEVVELMLAQLSWTLRQEPAIRAFRVSIDGRQIQLPGGVSEFEVDTGEQYDPAGQQASSLLFGLRDGLLVYGPPESLQPVEGPLGVKDFGLRSVAVNMSAGTAAGVSGDGRSILTAPVRTVDGPVTEVLSGATDFLQPAWDLSDRLWLVDRGSDGARVSYVENGHVRPVEVPGVSGRTVKSFLVSRDGSRFVAVVRGRRHDSLRVGRIGYADGRVSRVTRPHRINWEGVPDLRVRDIAWRSPTAVAVLRRASGLPEVRTFSVDGAPSGLDGVSTNVRNRVRALAGSPVQGESLYAVTRTSLDDLSSPVGGTIALDPRVTVIGYVG